MTDRVSEKGPKDNSRIERNPSHSTDYKEPDYVAADRMVRSLLETIGVKSMKLFMTLWKRTASTLSRTYKPTPRKTVHCLYVSSEMNEAESAGNEPTLNEAMCFSQGEQKMWRHAIDAEFKLLDQMET